MRFSDLAVFAYVGDEPLVNTGRANPDSKGMLTGRSFKGEGGGAGVVAFGGRLRVGRLPLVGSNAICSCLVLFS